MHGMQTNSEDSIPQQSDTQPLMETLGREMPHSIFSSEKEKCHLRTRHHLYKMAEWAENSAGGHTKCGNSTMYLCPLLLPPTIAAATLNSSSV